LVISNLPAMVWASRLPNLGVDIALRERTSRFPHRSGGSRWIDKLATRLPLWVPGQVIFARRFG